MADELAIEAAHADHMAAMARYWMERAQKAERDALEMVGRLALANGGELRLTMDAALPHSSEITLERYTDHPTMDTVFRAVISQGRG